MAAKKPENEGAAKTLSGKQLRRIWTELKPQPLLERLRAIRPEGKWVLAGHRISGSCPYHDDRTPSFHIYVDRGYAKCFGCDTFVWNPLALWATLTRTRLSDALLDLRQTSGVATLSTRVQSQLKGWERHQALKRRIAAICHDELLSAVANPGDHNYAYAQTTVDYLLRTRLLPSEALPALPMLGVVPPIGRILDTLAAEAHEENERRAQEALLTGERVEKVTSLEKDAEAYLQGAAGWMGAIVFQLDVAPDTIGRLKLRRPDTKDFLYLDDAYEEELGFFGLGWPLYKSLLGADPRYNPGVYVVEGEFDVLSLMARQVLAGGPTFLTVSTGGGAGGPYLDNLRHFGFNEIFLVSDAPAKKGDALIEAWLQHIRHLRAKIFTGYTRFPGMGDPDQVVVTHGLDPWQQALLSTKDRALFQTPQDWVFDRAAPEIEAIDEQDVRYRIEIAGTWGRLLKNGHECDAYVDTCRKAYDLPAPQLKREIVAREEDEPAFIVRVSDVLAQTFYVIGQRALDNDRRLYLWHKEKRSIIRVALADDGSIERELGAVLGTTYQFFTDAVGIPSFLEVPENIKAAGRYLQNQDKSYRWYLRQALLMLAQDAPDFDSAPHKGQGLHVLRDLEGGPPTLYLVNGRDVYHGTYAGTTLTWKALEGPSHNNTIFDVGIKHPEPAWLDNVRKAEHLDRADAIDTGSLWDRVHGVLDTGWVFKDHTVTVEFLTAHLLAAAICNAFRRQVTVSFNADTSAGKSRLVMGLIGGNDFPRIHILKAAVAMPRYSAAGIRQDMNNKTRPLCLDEFEDEGVADKKSRVVAETQEMFRNAVGADNVCIMGSRGGEPVKYHLNFFLFTAAITKPRRVQDANRVIPVNLPRVEGREDPVQVLMQTFGSTFMEELRDDLSIGLFPHIARIQETYEEIEKEYGQAGSKPITVDTRFFEALYPALTMMKFLGKDYRQFVLDFCEANRESIEQHAAHTDSQALFDWICNSPKLKLRVGEHHDRNDATLLQLLASPDTREEINVSGSGLFYDNITELLVVNWTQAIQTVLSGHARYGRETNIYNLRDLAGRGPYAVKHTELAASGALGRLRAFGLGTVTASHVTGYRVSHLIRGISVPTSSTENGLAVVTPLSEKMIDDGEFSA